MYQQMEKTDNEHYEEDEDLKKWSVKEFQAFVNNHPFIKHPMKIDENHALSFLRARRYVMPKSKELFERACIFLKQNPDLCEMNEHKFDRIMELYDSGAVMVLNDRDSFGRRVILCVTRKFDISKFTVDDTMRLFTLIHCVLSFETETQKHGIVFINDLKGLSASHLKIFPYKMLVNYSSYINISTTRIKEIYIVGIPAFAVQLFKAVRYVLDDKSRNRLRVMSETENLWKFVDQNIMTKDYGGSRYTDEQVLRDFKATIMEKKNRLFEITNNFEIDLEKASKTHKIRIEKKKKSDGLLEFD